MDTYGELLMMLAFLLAVGMILYRFWTCRGQGPRQRTAFAPWLWAADFWREALKR